LLVVLELGIHVDHGFDGAFSAVVRLLDYVRPSARGAVFLRLRGGRPAFGHRDERLDARESFGRTRRSNPRKNA
jgi:hypothetical protein